MIDFANRSANGIVVTTTPTGLARIRWRYWLIWMILNASFVPLVYFFYPETCGLTLEQIDQIFEADDSGRNSLMQSVKESLRMQQPDFIFRGDYEHQVNENKTPKRDVEVEHVATLA
ncbi:uncharacterized protein A1O9_09899 [Exophiala aquamarina CBS 119918]|uniref:Major facilitator superfamily (MFS) profile domain-containing protein n=1 Tax=Exophiala aquamarina CBS 119918 TaxID=1182545 RepID=A0A072P1U9_9EURO|nr:uncharacterized protein A1O9_09899 [Exophiala aquamarina CBS 119918]KEF54104.1 hypothetical protein A1O9_09899 [Exophiala aquamarina CBS 119918]